VAWKYHNTNQARKDVLDRQILVESLKEKIKKVPKIDWHKEYRKYLMFSRNSVSINQDKVEYDSRFDRE
jgi:hypothetical protein